MVELSRRKESEKVDPTFWNDIVEFSKKLLGEDDVLVVSHHDADGIAACAIMVDLLRCLGKDVEFILIKQLDSTTIGGVKETDKVVVLTDMGSGQLGLIEDSNINKYYIIDHHQPEKRYELQVNPHFYGYDGGLDISGAGMTYLVAKAVGHDKMPHVAVVGSIGDMQDNGGRLHSLNRNIMYDAIEKGKLKVKNDLRLFGRQSRPLHYMLAYSSDPVLPGLTGDIQACAQFIESHRIKLKDEFDEWRSYVDLTHLERRELATALYIHLLDLNTPEFIIQRMIGEVYTLLDEKGKTELRDAKEFSTVLNACGRQGQPEIGVGVCLGDRGEKFRSAKGLLERHRKMLREGIEYLIENGVNELKNLYYFDAGDAINESIVGVVAGMAYGAGISTLKPDKPIIAFASDKDDPSFIKVSARANWNLVRRGLHLGNAMNKESKKLGGEGGGHDIAAGARIPKESKNTFLENVDRVFRKQLKVD